VGMIPSDDEEKSNSLSSATLLALVPPPLLVDMLSRRIDACRPLRAGVKDMVSSANERDGPRDRLAEPTFAAPAPAVVDEGGGGG
jgi:hypothetical protein